MHPAPPAKLDWGKADLHNRDCTSVGNYVTRGDTNRQRYRTALHEGVCGDCPRAEARRCTHLYRCLIVEGKTVVRAEPNGMEGVTHQ